MLSRMKRRVPKGLGLLPVSDIHDKFMQNPGAEALLAEAERELTEVEHRYNEAVAQGRSNPMAYAWAPKVVIPLEMQRAEMSVPRRLLRRLDPTHRTREDARRGQYPQLVVVEESAAGHALLLWPEGESYRVENGGRPICACDNRVDISSTSTRCRAGVELFEAMIVG